MNRISLVGRLTAKPELRYTNSNKAVCMFAIAVNRDKDNADFLDIRVWDKQAENLCQYQDKGNLIGIDGTLRKDIYTKEDGTKTSSTYVLANHIEYLSNKTTQSEESTKEEDPYAEYGQSVNIDDSFLD